MQIGSGLSSFAPQRNATSSDSSQQIGRAGALGGVAQGAELSHATVPAQDAAVTISAQGAAAAARERTAAASSTEVGASGVSGGLGHSSGGAVSNASVRDASPPSSGPSKSGVDDASAVKSTATKASPVKSFAYGTLGLERPDKPKEDTNKAYTAGRWLAAGATLWGLLALILA
jgi:hypothetical protein